MFNKFFYLILLTNFAISDDKLLPFDLNVGTLAGCVAPFISVALFMFVFRITVKMSRMS